MEIYSLILFCKYKTSVNSNNDIKRKLFFSVPSITSYLTKCESCWLHIIYNLYINVVDQLLEQFEDIKGESEFVNRRRTKRKSTKEQTTIYKTLSIKLEIEQHESH
jgi:hypothetical protein